MLGSNGFVGYDQNVQRLLQRIEELEDIIVEMKQQQSVTDVVETK
jgi:hypothetical protein